MKKTMTFLMAMAFLAPAATLAARTEQPADRADNDTLVVNYPRKVTVITGDSLQTVRIEGRHDDYDFHYENTIQLVDSNYVSELSLNPDRWEFTLPIGKKKDRDLPVNNVTTHLGVGGCMALNAPYPMDVEFNSSFEIFWTIMQWDYTRSKSSHHTFSTGFGVDWRNFRMNGSRWRFEKQPDDRLAITPYPSDDVSKQFSRIKVFSAQFSVFYTYHIGHGFSLTAGPVLNMNSWGTVKTRYRLNGEKHKETAKNAHVNPVTVDLMGIIKTPAFNVYVKYSSCNMLKTDYAPKFQSLSMGIYL